MRRRPKCGVKSWSALGFLPQARGSLGAAGAAPPGRSARRLRAPAFDGPDRREVAFAGSFGPDQGERAVRAVGPALDHRKRCGIRGGGEEILARKTFRMGQRERELTRHAHEARSAPVRLTVKPTEAACSPV